MAFELLVGPALEDGEEQVVERAEVVVHEGRSDARVLGDAPGADGRVAVVDHDPFGHVEEPDAGLGRLGAHAAGFGHA